MLVHSPGVTRLIDRLEKKQLVTRERSEKDRRVVLCKVTEKGRDLLGTMDKPVEEMNKEVVKNLTTSQIEELIELLSKLTG